MLYRDLKVPIRAAEKPATTKRKLEERNTCQPSGARRPKNGAPSNQVTATKKRRSVNRSERMTEQTHIEGSFLRASSVGTATLENYQRHWQEFTTWCKKKKLSIIKEVELDRALVQYLDVVYAAGEGLGIGNYVKASVLFHHPELKGRLGLPKTQQALKGWRRLNPPKSRMPIPFEVVALMAVEAKKNNKVEIGLVLLLSYMLYLRPGEFAKIRVCDVVRPVPRGGPLYQHWGIVLHPQEEGIPSKTAQWDEALTLDLPYQNFLGKAIDAAMRLRSRPPTETVFKVTAQEVNLFMQQQWQKHHFETLNAPRLYRLRHGGASFELAGRLRPITEVQIRGRWETVRSLKNYEKGSRLSQLFGSLPEAKQQECIQATEQLAAVFLDRPCKFKGR